MLKKIGEIATEVTMTVKEATYGNACLVMGHGTLKRASDAGVNCSQTFSPETLEIEKKPGLGVKK